MSHPNYAPYPSGDLIKSKAVEELNRRLHKKKEDFTIDVDKSLSEDISIERLYDIIHVVTLKIVEYYRNNPNELHKTAGRKNEGMGV